MRLRMRWVAGGLTMILLLQPIAILACLCACLAREAGSHDRLAQASETGHGGCGHGALPPANLGDHRHSLLAHDSSSCAHGAPAPATLRPTAELATSRVVPGEASAAIVTSPALTSDRLGRRATASESPPLNRFVGPLRI